MAIKCVMCVCVCVDDWVARLRDLVGSKLQSCVARVRRVSECPIMDEIVYRIYRILKGESDREIVVLYSRT